MISASGAIILWGRQDLLNAARSIGDRKVSGCCTAIVAVRLRDRLVVVLHRAIMP
jgi:hypothetical protein